VEELDGYHGDQEMKVSIITDGHDVIHSLTWYSEEAASPLPLYTIKYTHFRQLYQSKARKIKEKTEGIITRGQDHSLYYAIFPYHWFFWSLFLPIIF
jgi:hypothetical protein